MKNLLKRRWVWLMGCAIFVPVLCCCGLVIAIALPTIRFNRLPVESTRYTLDHDGQERVYRLYVPENLDPATPVPLVLALHGGGGTADSMERISDSGFHPLADRDGFIVAYPQGIDKGWNDSRPGVDNDADDVGFIAALIDHLSAEYAIDPDRVFVTGISNGGHMSYRLACQLSDRIAAIAPVAANVWDGLVENCAPLHPVPVLIMNGTEDPLVKWDGGEIKFLGDTRGEVRSADETVTFWRNLDECPEEPETREEPDRDPDDHTRVHVETYAPCADGSQVVLYEIDDGGHTWPGGNEYLWWRLVGRTSRDIDATAEIWAFFQAVSGQ
jgi:polyhydroxybutyrate depolymerase